MKRRRRYRIASRLRLRNSPARELPRIDRPYVVPFERKGLQHALVEVDDTLVFPIAGWVLGLRVEEIVAEVDGKRLETARDGARTASMHSNDGDPARTANHRLEPLQMRNPALAGFKRNKGVAALRLADGAFHLHLYQAIELDGVLHRQLLDEEVEEAVDDHRDGVGLG